MKKETRLLLGKAAYLLTRGRVRTHLVKEDLKARAEKRKEQSIALQKELDREHSRGWGYRASDGVPISWEPFTKATEQERRESWQK